MSRSVSYSAVVPLAAVAGCGRQSARVAYTPHTRAVTITTVPLLVKEERAIYPFLDADFAEGGVLEGKEVYAFVPSTITVVESDTIQLTLINPEDDEHSFVLPDLAVTLPGQSVKEATCVARRAGVYRFVCSVPSHLPMMWGQLVVLPQQGVAAMPAVDGEGR